MIGVRRRFGLAVVLAVAILPIASACSKPDSSALAPDTTVTYTITVEHL